MILAIETATPVCSVALRNTERGAIAEKRSIGASVHSEMLFTSIEQLMKEFKFGISDLSAVVVSSGPGSYTGLRIAASAVKGLLFHSKVPLYSAQTLVSFAVQALHCEPEIKTIHSVIDARRNHLYHEQFHIEKQRLVKESKAESKTLEYIQSILRPGDAIIGTGLNRLHPESVEGCFVMDESSITAKSLINMFQKYSGTQWLQRVDPLAFEPFYMGEQQSKSSEKTKKSS